MLVTIQEKMNLVVRDAERDSKKHSSYVMDVRWQVADRLTEFLREGV